MWCTILVISVVERGDLASVSAVKGHGFSHVPSLMYIFRGLALPIQKNSSVLPPSFDRVFRAP